MNYSNRDNFTLLQSSKIAPRIHQNTPFSKKKFWKTPLPVGMGKHPTPSVSGIQPLLPQHDISELPPRKGVEDPPMSEVCWHSWARY